MKVARHNTAAQFLSQAGDWLELAEAENNLILGIAGFFKSNLNRPKTEPYYLTVENDGILGGAALMTPPRRLVITRMPESGASVLADYLCAEGASVQGVLGPTECTRVFAEKWRSNTGISLRRKRRERIYACTDVIAPGSRPGYLRTANSNDEPLLVKWVGEFCREAKIEDEADYMRSQVPASIKNERVYLWVNGEVVSMADLRRDTAHGIAVSLVYTPPTWRNQGYASSCVAALTKRMLDEGKRFCCLFTDLANPTANRIYHRIGYGRFATSMIGCLTKD